MRNRLHACGRIIVRTIPLLVGIVLLVLILAWMSGTFRKKILPGEEPFQQRTAENETTTTVRLLTTPERVDAVGTIQPRRKTDVAGKLLATIREITVQPGDRVRPKQRLVALDDREIQAQLREIEAARLGVESDLSVRRREYQRYKQMFAEKAVSKEDYDRVKGTYDVAQSQIKRTDAQIQRMKVMLSYTEIRAQTGGIVADRYADPGDLAAPGKPLLTIYKPAELELHASVPESLATDVTIGQRLPVRIDSRSLSLTGTVREIVPQAQAASRSVLVKVSLPADKTKSLYVGMFGRLKITVGTAHRVVVPADVVLQIGQLDVVHVVAGGKIMKRRSVRTGRRFGDDVEILSGLRVGEQVLRHGFPKDASREGDR